MMAPLMSMFYGISSNKNVNITVNIFINVPVFPSNVKYIEYKSYFFTIKTRKNGKIIF